LLVIFLKDSGEPEEEKVVEKQKQQIKIEHIGDTYYAWKENDFIVQSKKVEDVLDHIKQKFPNTNFLIVSNKDLSQWLAKN
jgi:hypothetical protein